MGPELYRLREAYIGLGPELYRSREAYIGNAPYTQNARYVSGAYLALGIKLKFRVQTLPELCGWVAVGE